MSGHFDVAVIGGGIVGLAHAWMAARRHLRVILIERSAVAQGASIRNFGMIWPVGQPSGELYDLALRSREFWLELHTSGTVDVEECGSLHLAYRPDESAVLEEFRAEGSHNCQLLSPDEIVARSPIANPNGLLSGLWSPTELRINPRTATARMASWLTERFGVECCFGTAVTHVEDDRIHTADARQWTAKRIIVCSGSDLQTLYPKILQNSGLQLCKLQMLKGAANPVPNRPTPHIAGGLTLRHYTAFRDCPSLQALRNRIAGEAPEMDRYGIHVMASHFGNGDVILGDSHEYGAQITPFDSTEIDELIIQELRKVIQLSDWTIRERWHGIYAKHPTLPVFECEAEDGVQIFVGTGGAGMTMSFALADRAWNRWIGKTHD